MTTITDASNMGDFTVFGFTREPEEFLQRRLPDRLGITPRLLDFDATGAMFFHTTYQITFSGP